MKTLVTLALMGIAVAPLAAQNRGSSGVINHPGGERRGEPSRDASREPVNVSTSLDRTASIRRAGLWGRCVVTRDRLASAAFASAAPAAAVKLRRSDALSRTFGACRKESGDFALRTRVDVQQAAIRDALRAS